MKTQYSSLVKIKKERLDMMEKAVQSCHQTIRQIQERINKAYSDLRDLKIPEKGDFSLYRQMQLMKQRIQDDIAFNKHNLYMAENALIKAMQQLKVANIEHEKFKYLETHEVEKVLKAEKQREAKALDEVAVMMHNRNSDV